MNESIKFIERLEKDMKGFLTGLIILNIIQKNEEPWGYMIKQEYNRNITFNDELSDSTLYTTLRNLENVYGLVSSKMSDRRRTYTLSSYGKDVINTIYDYWMSLIAKSIDYLNFLEIPYNQDLMERLK